MQEDRENKNKIGDSDDDKLLAFEIDPTMIELDTEKLSSIHESETIDLTNSSLNEVRQKVKAWSIDVTSPSLEETYNGFKTPFQCKH